MTRVYRSASRPAAPEYVPPNASVLYGRSINNRRIMFLELIAWAIIQAEEAAARGETIKFTENLILNRRKHWLELPWKGAKEPERFEQHVLRLARGFTDDRGSYPLRPERAV